MDKIIVFQQNIKNNFTNNFDNLLISVSKYDGENSKLLGEKLRYINNEIKHIIDSINELNDEINNDELKISDKIKNKDTMDEIFKKFMPYMMIEYLNNNHVN